MKENLNNTFSIRDKKILNLLKIFHLISIFISTLGIITMYIHYHFFISFELYESAIIIFRTGLLAEVFSIMSALIINKFKNDY